MKFERKTYNYILAVVMFMIYSSFNCARTQVNHSRPTESTFSDPKTYMWLGSYGNFRLNKKFYWAGEFHFRRAQHNGVPFVGRMAQLYNRHGLKYVYSKNFSATLGGVLRFDFSPDPGNDDLKAFVLEPRIWQEYLFAMSFPRIMVYHRFRFEHRWSRKNFEHESPGYNFRNRYRYYLLLKIPLNNSKLIPGTYYFSPNVELIMQSGKTVIDNPLEDLRLFAAFTYIASPQVSYSAGATWTIGQSSAGGYLYNPKWIARFNVYISLDFRKFEQKIPEVNISD